MVLVVILDGCGGNCLDSVAERLDDVAFGVLGTSAHFWRNAAPALDVLWTPEKCTDLITMVDQPNIRDVAKAAGVSTATVSRALAQPDKVREATLKKVMAAVEEIGFVPNRQASMFRSRKSNTVILLVRDISNPFYLDIYKGVEEAAFEAGYKVLMGDAREDDERITHYIDAVRECHADGLILMIGSFPQKLLAHTDKLPPIVVALEEIGRLQAPAVRWIMWLLPKTPLLIWIAQGHRRIVHLTGPLDEYLGKARLQGYRQALEKAGLAIDEELIVPGDFSLNAGYDQTAKLLQRGCNSAPFSRQ